MSSTKYANLPDIDTAPDVYETEDIPASLNNKNDSSDDEAGAPSRQRGKGGDGHAKPDELDASSINPDDASKKFRHFEKKRPRARIQYTYPASQSSSDSEHETPAHRWRSTPKLTISQRIQNLKAEVESIEAELAAQKDNKDAGSVDSAVLIRELADVKSHLNSAGTEHKKNGKRGRLVNAVLHRTEAGEVTAEQNKDTDSNQHKQNPSSVDDVKDIDMMKFTAEIDSRLGTLERILGSSTTVLDETSPILPPLVVTVTRLHSMLTLLSQPRQIDNISRRLKLVQPDLERLSNANNSSHAHSASISASQRRQSSGHPLNSSISSVPASPITQSAPPNRTHLEQLTPILTRLTPILPNIPHILTRLRSLSALHTNAAAFQSTLERLEEQQRKERADLAELEKALEGIEKSIHDNEQVVVKNVETLEGRVDDVLKRVETLTLDQTRE